MTKIFGKLLPAGGSLYLLETAVQFLIPESILNLKIHESRFQSSHFVQIMISLNVLKQNWALFKEI